MTLKIYLRFFTALIVTLIGSCGNVGPLSGPSHRPVNYIVLLDLSDRLLQPGQAANDQALINTVFDHFRKTVFEKSLFISSKDKFRVVIAPQPGVAYNPDPYMSKLYLDLEQAPLGRKRIQAAEFEKALPLTLNALYASATRGQRQSSQYAGCDLWKYFNEQLATDLVTGADNQLVVLTDGYLDFEKNPHVVTKGRRSTSTDFLARLRASRDWQRTMQQQDWGLLPANVRLTNVRVSVVEISPKSANLDEAPLLREVWRKWLTEMHAARATLILKNNLSKSQALLQASLPAD